MATRKTNLEFEWPYLFLGAIPLAVYHLSDQLLNAFGYATNAVPALNSSFNGNAETSARLAILATFLIFCAVAAASIFAFVSTLFELSAKSRLRAIIFLVAAFALGAVSLKYLRTGELLDDINRGVFCDALNYLHSNASDVQKLSPSNAEDCVRQYNTPLMLISWWKWFVFASSAALVFGSILMLAETPEATDSRTHIERQAKKLNRFLYLSALLMVVTLLFLSAVLRWPQFAFQDNGGLDSQVDAVVLYYGVSYTVFLAAYYVPVAWLLAQRAERAGVDGIAERLAGFSKSGLTQFVNIASILAPTAAGILSALIQTPG